MELDNLGVLALFEKSFEIDGRQLGGELPCYVIAEAGVAHFGSLEKAKRLVDLAVDGNADAVKFQIFDVNEMISDAATEWKQRMASRSLSFADFEILQRYCGERGITFFATPHDSRGLSMLKELSVPAFKVGSGELRNYEFIEQILATNCPVIISTGMYSDRDLEDLIGLCKGVGNLKVALLHCVTQYPTPPEEANLARMSMLQEKYGGLVGYSDHSVGFHIPVAAVGMGAKVVEKHIALDFDIPDAQDWKVACGPDTFVEFVRQVREVESATCPRVSVSSENEIKNRDWACKSLVFSKNHKAGEVITLESLKAKRPGTGISPDQKKKVVGRRLNKSKNADSVLNWEDLQ